MTGRLEIIIEVGDLGDKTGAATTTVEQPDKVFITYDPRRLANPNGMRDLIMRELDLALTALIYNTQPEVIRAKVEELDRRHPI